MNTGRYSRILSIVWSLCGTIAGLLFIRSNRELAMSVVPLHLSKVFTSFWLVVAIVIAWILIFSFVKLVFNAISGDIMARRILLYSLPFLLVTLCMVFVNRRNGYYYSGDEYYVYYQALLLYPYAFVYTSEAYLVSFFILPLSLSPVLVKTVIDSLIMGYVVRRFEEHYRSKWVYTLFLFCLMPPFYKLGAEVHRMHWYGFIYLFFVVKLYFDAKEKQKNINENLYIIAIISLLTTWRREGIYLLIFGAIILAIAYLKGATKQQIAKYLGVFFICELLFFIPIITDGGMKERGIEIDAILVHMLGEESFDRDKVAKELEIIDKNVDISIIDKYNQEMGFSGFEMNYFDATWYKDGMYYMQRDTWGASYEEFSKAVISMVIKEPVVFIKSRIRAYIAAGYSLDFYNLILPLLIIFVGLIHGLRKDKAMFVLMLGLLAHISITTLTMPASFFKYFFHMWLVAYTFVVVLLMERIKRG